MVAIDANVYTAGTTPSKQKIQATSRAYPLLCTQHLKNSIGFSISMSMLIPMSISISISIPVSDFSVQTYFDSSKRNNIRQFRFRFRFHSSSPPPPPPGGRQTLKLALGEGGNAPHSKPAQRQETCAYGPAPPMDLYIPPLYLSPRSSYSPIGALATVFCGI